MSFLHVLGEIGKGVLKVAPIAAGLVNPALGTLVTAGAAIATAEIEHGSGEGPAKATQAAQIIAASPALAASPLPTETRAQHIRALIDAIVAALNAIACLFPAPPKPPA